jgi:hypothetical protein
MLKKFYKFCTFNAICKYNAAVTFIDLHHNMVNTLNSDGLYYANVNKILYLMSNR